MITPDQMAQIHARAFAGQGRAWRAAEFAALIESPHVIVAGDARAFGLSRVIADEAELLTLGVDPAHRRAGNASRVLDALEASVQTRGARRQFLEVAEDNVAARALYAGRGYAETALRAAYYAAPDASRMDALIMTKVFTPTQTP